MEKIFTLEARDSVLLEVHKSFFKQNDSQIRNEIQRLFSTTIETLESKGINYSELRHALVPSSSKKEIAFVFDTLNISNWYGYDVFKRIIPLFNLSSKHSILTGDLHGYNVDQETIMKMFNQHIVTVNQYEYRHSSQFYIVYINNFSDEMLRVFIDSLKDYHAFVGYFDLTFSSELKNYMSFILVNLFLKFKDYVIMGHEDDNDDNDNYNMPGFPFEKSGYKIRSLNSSSFHLLLSYKIERAVFDGFKSDTHFAINAISSDVIPIDDFKISISDSKLKYLQELKEGSLKRSDIISLKRQELEDLIKSKINSNYIYELTYLKKHDVAKFNIMIEQFSESTGNLFKLTVGLKYKPVEKVLEVITLF